MFEKLRSRFQGIPIGLRYVGLLFGLHVFISWNSLMPSLRDLNLWDEAVYLNTGKLLAEGQLPIFSRNPLVGLLLAITYLPFSHSPFWMMQSAAVSRIILFALMWFSTFLIAQQLRRYFSPFIMIALLFLMPLIANILINQSDALFAAMSGFALWQLLAYQDDKKIKHLGWGSFFVGLAALSRNDGLVLMAVYLVAVIFLTWRTKKKSWRLYATAVLPFAALIAGYVLIYGVTTGNYTLGTVERSYTAFQQGYIFDYRGNPDCNLSRMKCAVLEAQSIYGTPDENDASVLRAISRNPGAYMKHLQNVVTQLPKMMIQAYGGKTAFVFFLFVLRGLIELVQKKQTALLVVLALWPSYLFVYFLTFFRIGYLQTAFGVAYVAAAFGIHALLREAGERRELWSWSGVLAAMAIYGFVGGNASLSFAALVTLAAVWAIYWLRDLVKQPTQRAMAGALLLLAAGLIIRGSLANPPTFRQLGSIAEEQASLVMQESLPPGSLVAAGSPGSTWAARMQHFSLADDELLPIADSAGLHEFFVQHGVAAIYVDHELSNALEAIWELIENGIGTYYEEIYSGDEGSVRVLLVR